ncbi:MAG: beta-propeller domain-containing protein [Myxococcales bacterium]|nr:beta-propeller domain-containing protein [Myxococcales bacterium]
MYVRGGKVHLMLNESSRYVRSSGGAGAAMVGQWIQTSAVSVLDVTNPAAIVEVAQYDVPGSIADSRLVGDVLYLVTQRTATAGAASSRRPSSRASSGRAPRSRGRFLAFLGNTYRGVAA